MRVAIVLGSTGLIGRHVLAALRAVDGIRVMGGGRGDPPPDTEHDWIPVDLSSDPPPRLAARLRELSPALIVNCTGSTIGSARQLIESNVLTTVRLLELLKTAGTGARLVQVGSSAEYGPGTPRELVRESACPRPVSPYGVSKLAASQLVATAADAGTIDAVVLRVFNALGPGMPENTLPGRVSRLLRDAVRTGVRQIETGPLDPVRDFVDVRDIASAVVAAGLVPELDAGFVNVGSGRGHSVRELVDAMAVRIGFEGRILEVRPASSRSAGVQWQVADISLARGALGWQPTRDLPSSVELLLGDG